MSDPTYEYRVLTADGQHFTADDSATFAEADGRRRYQDEREPQWKPHRVERRSIGVWEPVERRQVMSAAEFQVCSRCGQEYPYPVELHHSGKECAQRRRPALRVLLMVYDEGSRNGWETPEAQTAGFNNALDSVLAALAEKEGAK